MDELNFQTGATYAALPELLLDELTDFQHGGICSPDESRSVLVGEIQDFLRQEDKIVIFEDSLRRSTDPVIRENRYRLNVITDVDETYYYLTTLDALDEAKISRTCKFASSKSAISFTGFFTAVKQSCGTDQVLSSFQQNLYTSVDNITSIVIGAFDRESYLLWRKCKPS